MNYITEFIIHNKDKYLIIDNDMFFVDNYNLNNLDNYYVGYVEQIRILNNKKYIYPWPNLLYINTLLAPNLLLNLYLIYYCMYAARGALPSATQEGYEKREK